MTVLVADNTMMVADRMISDGDVKVKVDKIFRVRSDLLGISGDYSMGIIFKKWYEECGDWKDAPYVDSEFAVLVLNDSGLWVYENAFVPYRVPAPYFTGAGGGYAQAAYMAKPDLIQAVKITNEISAVCGLGVQVKRLRTRGKRNGRNT